MTRFAALPLLLAVCLCHPTPGLAAPPAREPGAAGLPFVLGDREPTDDDIHVFTKVFLVGMRNHHGDRNANALRKFFDPRYLKKHDLAGRDLPAQMAPVGDILNYQIADDRRTVLCLVETKADPKAPVKEALLLRLAVHEGVLYLAPVKAPDPATGSFAPWILRTKI